MKKLVAILLFGLSTFVFSQDKTYRFLYDFHQKTILDRTENQNMSQDDWIVITREMNRSYEVEVVANSNYSFVKVLEKIDNSQDNPFIKIEPEPKWLLNDFGTKKSYEYSDYGKIYLIDSIHKIEIRPTHNSKKILGFEAKEFIAEDKSLEYRFWLLKYNNINVSPLKYQLKGYIILEAELTNKKLNDEKTERKVTYILKNMTEEEQPFNYEKLIPKKVITKEELNIFIEKMNQSHQGVDKD